MALMELLNMEITMKKTLAALLMTLSVPAFAVCSYPLNATQSQLGQLPFLNGWQLPPSVSNQTIEFSVIPTATNSLTRYAAFSSTGIDAMTTSYNSGLPGGDVTLPASGIAVVAMNVDSFPWQQLSLPGETVGMHLTMMTGNQQSLPGKDSLQYNVSVISSTNTATPFYVSVLAESVTAGYATHVNKNFSFTPPAPATSIGLYLNMDTRQVGLAADGGLVQYLNDTQGNPLLIPANVTSVALGLGGYIFNVQNSEPLVGAPVGASLITDICAGPVATLLPNGKVFKGKGNAFGLSK